MELELVDLLGSTLSKTFALNHSATFVLRCGRHDTRVKHTVKLST
jgi:hypothetical protein